MAIVMISRMPDGSGIEFNSSNTREGRLLLEVDSSTVVCADSEWMCYGADFPEGFRVVDGKLTPLPPKEIDVLLAAKRAATTLQQKEALIERYIEGAAKADGWRSQESCMAAAGYPNKWQAKAKAYIAWWELCWSTAHAIFDEVSTGKRPIPTDEELIAAMPQMKWPVLP